MKDNFGSTTKMSRRGFNGQQHTNIIEIKGFKSIQKIVPHDNAVLARGALGEAATNRVIDIGPRPFTNLELVKLINFKYKDHTFLLNIEEPLSRSIPIGKCNLSDYPKNLATAGYYFFPQISLTDPSLGIETAQALFEDLMKDIFTDDQIIFTDYKPGRGNQGRNRRCLQMVTS
ncbi:hypothetical protein JW962_02990 [Candidatus Dojkabacteria bacterium]|nr:hypothetical protein [Candidatus Dojkabacteria bacterium]